MDDLEPYITPKGKVALSKEMLLKRQRGVPYLKAAQAYVFQKQS